MEESKEYSVDIKLRKLWNGLMEKVSKTNSDRVYIVDGRERYGKSTFTFQQACYIEPSLMDSPEKLVSRIAFTPQEFLDAVRNTKNGVIIFDEAFRGLSSRSAMSKVNKSIIQALMEMGQNNNVVFIVLPSFFMLDSYPAMHRSDILFHIYMDKKGGRCFVAYNHADKNKIYQIGLIKGHNYAFFSRFRGRFYGKFPGGKEFEDAYLKKKAAALRNMFGEVEKEEEYTPEELEIFKEVKERGKTKQRVAIEHGIYPVKVSRIVDKVDYLLHKQKQLV